MTCFFQFKTSRFLYIGFLILFWIGFISPHADARSKQQYTLTGQTMGTVYKIKYITDEKASPKFWQKRVEVRLSEINRRLSMFDPDSELSRFNMSPPGSFGPISDEFFTIIQTAESLHRMTGGAWDGTIKPLVDLWGFGTQTPPDHLPETQVIRRALSNTGFHHIRITPDNRLAKSHPVTLDLGSIAKGYGVDALAQLFIREGIKDLLVEIGGELYGSGRNKKGQFWSVGISRPEADFTRQRLYKIIRLDHRAIATSGNYRNFYERNGRIYSHIIDPKTGFPVTNEIVSASVISSDCTFADGLATALMVMDVQDGIDLVNTLKGTECLIVQKKGDRFIDHTSENFDQLLIK